MNRWTFSEASLFEIFKMNLDPVFEYAKPGFIGKFRISISEARLFFS